MHATTLRCTTPRGLSNKSRYDGVTGIVGSGREWRIMHDFLIAIPAYNEGRHINNVLGQVARYACDVLVVDDGSTDTTPDLLAKRPGIHVIHHPENRGYGQSLAEAFAFAQGRGYAWVITMDCDGQHEADQLPLFFSHAKRGVADVISGTRYAVPINKPVNVPPARRRINRTITAIINDRLNMSITDAFCGFKAYRVSILDRFALTVPGYAMPMQMWVQIAQAGLTVHEVPVRLVYNDPNRHFGGMLDNPTTRLAHYLDVFETALAGATAMPVCACGSHD